MKITIAECIQKYLSSVKLSRSANTFRTYSNAMRLFIEVLEENEIEPDKADVTTLPEDAVIRVLTALKDFSSATEQVYITSVVGLFEFNRRREPCAGQPPPHPAADQAARPPTGHPSAAVPQKRH